MTIDTQIHTPFAIRTEYETDYERFAFYTSDIDKLMEHAYGKLPEPLQKTTSIQFAQSLNSINRVGWEGALYGPLRPFSSNDFAINYPGYFQYPVTTLVSESQGDSRLESYLSGEDSRNLLNDMIKIKKVPESLVERTIINASQIEGGIVAVVPLDTKHECTILSIKINKRGKYDLLTLNSRGEHIERTDLAKTKALKIVHSLVPTNINLRSTQLIVTAHEHKLTPFTSVNDSYHDNAKKKLRSSLFRVGQTVKLEQQSSVSDLLIHKGWAASLRKLKVEARYEILKLLEKGDIEQAQSMLSKYQPK